MLPTLCNAAIDSTKKRDVVFLRSEKVQFESEKDDENGARICESEIETHKSYITTCALMKEQITGKTPTQEHLFDTQC